MTAPEQDAPAIRPAEPTPYVSPEADLPELTWGAVALGAVLGIIFGASSLYLVLKVGLTVSASIPVAVLAITLFRGISRAMGIRRATILENNIVQTTGSAGESIAFGVGVTMPALMLLGFDMDAVRVMTVGVLGGLLGILMMIPLRRAFIVKQHDLLKYPEGTACADVLIAGEKGGSTARTVFAGFGIAFIYKFAMEAMKTWSEEVNIPLFNRRGQGLKGGVFGGEVSPELLGVGYIIGPKIASIMLSGAALAYLVIVPAIVFFAGNQARPLPPATRLVADMQVKELRNAYVLYIGAGAVATGGLISMVQALPLIFSSIRSGLRDVRVGKPSGGESAAAPSRQKRAGVLRTDLDLPMKTVLFGSLGLILALAASPWLGLGLSLEGIAGAALIVFFGFLFVTVSSRLTGEIGSSSNPISGMTVATLLFTCLIFLLLGRTHKAATLTAMTVAAVVCVASSNGGSTAQDLKTGYLLGATPRKQQYAILIGALTSAIVIGVTLLLLNHAGTVYTTKAQYLPDYRVPDVAALPTLERAGGQYASDSALYHVLNVAEGEIAQVPQGRYLVDGTGKIRYLVDPGINGRVDQRDDGTPVSNKFEAPKTRLMALIVDGILNQKLPWSLVLLGVVIAVAVELLGVPSLPFAVGVYLPIQTSVPIFVGGAVRWIVDKLRPSKGTDGDMSAGALLSTGYIAGGTIAGVVVAFMTFLPDRFNAALDLSSRLGKEWSQSPWPAAAVFMALTIGLLVTGLRRPRPERAVPTPET